MMEECLVDSCSMLSRYIAFEDVGGFDENFDWLDVAMMFCMRMKVEGWKVKYANRSTGIS